MVIWHFDGRKAAGCFRKTKVWMWSNILAASIIKRRQNFLSKKGFQKLLEGFRK